MQIQKNEILNNVNEPNSVTQHTDMLTSRLQNDNVQQYKHTNHQHMSQQQMKNA